MELSALPDPILALILAALPNTIQACHTSVLSRRWRNIWKLVPSFRFSQENFPDKERFAVALTNAFLLRDHELQLDTLFIDVFDFNQFPPGIFLEIRGLNISSIFGTLTLPPQFFAGNDFLRELNVSGSISIPSNVLFRALRSLRFSDATLLWEGENLFEVNLSLPVLECLYSCDTTWGHMQKVRILAPNLKVFEFINSPESGLRIFDYLGCPTLEISEAPSTFICEGILWDKVNFVNCGGAVIVSLVYHESVQYNYSGPLPPALWHEMRWRISPILQALATDLTCLEISADVMKVLVDTPMPADMVFSSLRLVKVPRLGSVEAALHELRSMSPNDPLVIMDPSPLKSFLKFRLKRLPDFILDIMHAERNIDAMKNIIS